ARADPGVPECRARVRTTSGRRRHPAVQILAMLRPGGAGEALPQPARESDEALETVADRCQGAQALRRLYGRARADAGRDPYRIRAMDPGRFQRPALGPANAAARPARQGSRYRPAARRYSVAEADAQAARGKLRGAASDSELCNSRRDQDS